MNSQIFMVDEILEHLVRNTTNSHLQCGAVFNKGCDVLSYLDRYIRPHGAIIQLRQHGLMPDQTIYLFDIDETVAMGPGHVWIYFGNYKFCFVNRSPCNIYRGSKRAKTMFVRM